MRPLRLGAAEESILVELRRIGGPVPRQLLVRLLHDTASSRRGARSPTIEKRTLKNAESTLSRALRSLERKKLVSRTYSRASQTLVSLSDPPPAPQWELHAEREEAFAARCDAAAAELTQLARRARRRASRLRVERTTAGTAREREGDRARWRQLLTPWSR